MARNKAPTPEPGIVYQSRTGGACEIATGTVLVRKGMRLLGSNPIVQATFSNQWWFRDGESDPGPLSSNDWEEIQLARSPDRGNSTRIDAVLPLDLVVTKSIRMPHPLRAGALWQLNAGDRVSSEDEAVKIVRQRDPSLFARLPES
jgi:hypothetical protein